MKKKQASRSAFFNPRLLISFAVCAISAVIVLFAFALYPGGKALARGTEQLRAQENVRLAQESLAAAVAILAIEENGEVDLPSVGIQPLPAPLAPRSASGTSSVGVLSVNPLSTARAFTVSGGDFSPNEAVNVLFNGTSIGVTAANAAGRFSFTVTSGSTGGFVSIQTIGGTSKREARGVLEIVSTGDLPARAVNPPSPSAPNATFVVNTTNDTQDATPGDGACADSTAACSLRAAITEANALAGADIITLPAGTYTTTLGAAGDNVNAGGDFDITSELTINGAAAGTTIIQAAAAPDTATERVIHCVTAATAVVINDVTIRHGNAPTNVGGSGIRLETATTNVTLNRVIVTLNRTAGAGGGIGLLTAGIVLNINESSITGNNAGSSVAASGTTGAGINIPVLSTVNITNSIISANTINSSVQSTFGAGVNVTGVGAVVTITNTSINSNVSTATGAGFAGFAGAVYNQQATVSLSNCIINANSSSHFHGAIRALGQTAAATTNITTCTLSTNSAPGEGGCMANFGVGAASSIINITGSTINGNTTTAATSAGGGILNFSNSTGAATVNVTNSTVSGNSAQDAGGIYNDGAVATVNLNYSTVSNNTAVGSGGGLFQDVTAGGLTNLKSSIVANNTAPTGPDIFGTITSQNFNHVESIAGGTFASLAGDITGTDPQLGGLANNGGPTFTHLPGPASPVLNTIPPGSNECGTTVTVDQRGLVRPSGAGCDKGSVEVQQGATPTPSASPSATAAPTATATATASATVSPTATASASATASATASPSASAGTPTPSPTCAPALTEGFESVPAIFGAGWAQDNNSEPLGASTWTQGAPGSGLGAAQGGTTNSFAVCNFNSTTGAGTISNWLLTPVLTLQDGATLTFWTRTAPGSTFPDRLQVRMSTAGASVNVGTTSTDVGDFTALLVDINPTLASGGYPNAAWTQFTATVTGVPTQTTGRMAFRYFVTNGGPDGANSNIVGLDTVDYNGPCGASPTPGTPSPSPSATASASATATIAPSATPSATSTPPGGTATPSATASPSASGTPGASPSPAQAINFSTRMFVQTGDRVGIGGFIITGTVPKHVLLRAIGPSLTQNGIVDPLADPVIELHGPGSFATITNNNWRDTQETVIESTGIPPTNDFESAIDATLPPGNYTAVVRGNNNTTGTALVEVYDLDAVADSRLSNISTRAFVGTGDDVVIAGFILGNNSGDDQVIVRGLGPSLAGLGVSSVLANPTLELRDNNGSLLTSNNDWQDNVAQAAIITAAGLAPSNDLEAAIAETLPPGLYTALLAGVNKTAGNGLVEVYDLGDGSGVPPPPSPTPGGSPAPSPTPGGSPSPSATPGGTPGPSATPVSSPTPTPAASPSPPSGACVENFDGVTAPALPAGWTATNAEGPAPFWVTSVSQPFSPANCAFVPDAGLITDKRLDSRPITVGSGAVLSFKNNYNTEYDPPPNETFWDGWVLEVSSPNVNGGAFTDIIDPAAGGSFVSGAYTGVITGIANNPLSDRMAWSGNSGGYIDTVINMGSILNGQTVTLRFRIGTDEKLAAPGVRVDDISITNASCP